MPKKKKLLEQAQSLTTPRRKTWFDLLPDDAQQELLDLKREFQSGNLRVTASLIHQKVVNVEYPNVVSKPTFVRWIKDT